VFDDDEVPEWVDGLPAAIEFEVIAESEWWERVAAEVDE